jgi:NADH-quinone oxidoreductase subunit J
MSLIFYIAAIVAIASTIMVITQYNAVHALLYLIVSLLSVAVIFFVIGAPFVAALEVIIYAGAIMVLFVFVIMMLNMGSASESQEKSWLSPTAWVGPGILALILLVEFVYIISAGRINEISNMSIGPKQVGISLFSTYLLGVELSAFLLLAGIVGAYHLGRKKKSALHRYLADSGKENSK